MMKISVKNKNYNRLQITTEYSYDGRKVKDSTTNYSSTMHCLVERKKVVGKSDKNHVFSLQTTANSTFIFACSYIIQLRNENQEEIDYKLQVHSSNVLNNFEKVKKKTFILFSL